MGHFTIELLENFERELSENGYFVYELCDSKQIEEICNTLKQKLRQLTGSNSIELENYHKLELSDKEHYKLQHQITQFYRDSQLGQQVIEKNSQLYRYIFGPDIELQREPYLRIVRPGAGSDNLGFHRDTFYGTSAHELSTIIPFVDLDEKNSLCIYPGSHVVPDHEFQIDVKESEKVQKGDIRNQSGFLYREHRMNPEIDQHMKPICLKKGQALVFILSTIHGTRSNSSQTTRWSSDIRVKNSFHPGSDTLKKGYYSPFRRSVILTSSEQLVQS